MKIGGRHPCGCQVSWKGPTPARFPSPNPNPNPDHRPTPATTSTCGLSPPNPNPHPNPHLFLLTRQRPLLLELLQGIKPSTHLLPRVGVRVRVRAGTRGCTPNSSPSRGLGTQGTWAQGHFSTKDRLAEALGERHLDLARAREGRPCVTYPGKKSEDGAFSGRCSCTGASLTLTPSFVNPNPNPSPNAYPNPDPNPPRRRPRMEELG